MADTISPISIISTRYKKVHEIRFLTKDTFVVRFERGNIRFIAGQHIIVGLKGSIDQREYSIYSSEHDDSIEILVKAVTEGNVSIQLMNCKPGDYLNVNGPFGYFRLEKEDLYLKKYLFIATGTGISPFHSFVTTYPGIDYTILHGIRYKNESYGKSDFDPERYISCLSGEKNGKYTGYVTRFLPEYADSPEMMYYICGNSSMIYDVTRYLKDKGIPRERILREVYF